MMWRPCREALLAAGVFALVSLFLTEAAADRQFEPPVRLEEQEGASGDWIRRVPVRRLQQASSSDVTQVQTRAKNTIDGQLNFPDPSTGPKPEVLAQQFTAKVAQAVPTVGPKVVNLTNAIYQNLDLAPVMSRLVSLAQSNVVGAFPGQNPYGFQADPNTFCLFAVPKSGGAATDPASQLNSWLAKNPLDSLGSSLQQAGLPGQDGKLPALPDGTLSWAAARQPLTPPDAGVIGLQKDGKTYACTPYQPFGGGASPLAYGAAAQSPLAAALPDSSPLFPSDGTQLQPAASAAVQGAPTAAKGLLSPEEFTAQYLTATSGTGARPQLAAGSPAAAPSLAADIFADFADSAFYGAAPAPGGYGSSGVKRPPIAYYNAATGGVVVTPPKSLFTSFSKSLDKVMQGQSGNPFFDCVTMNSGVPPFKSFVQANGNNAQTLANHFVSYLKGDLKTPDGGLADKITFENPFDPNSKPINLKFNAERPYFNLPQGGLPFLAQPQGGPGLPASLQSQGGPPLLPPNALANPAVATAGGLAAPVDTTATPSFTSVVFDGYLSDCTVIIGSYPHGDGTFDKANDFQSVVVDGAWAMPLATAKLHAGQVAYVVPAAKGNGYPALDGANNRPGFCFDTALLLPEFNPMAVPLPDASWAGNGGLVASPLSTVLVFAASSGLTKAQLQAAFGIDSAIDISTFNALADALNKGGSGPGLPVLKADVKIQNAVTLGATALNNNSAAYASYAILLDQALGQAIVLNANAAGQASAAAGRHLLQQATPAPVDLSKASSVGSLMQFSMSSAASNPDPSVRSSLAPGLSSDFLAAAAAATANLNAQADAATNAVDVEKTSYYAQAVLADQLVALRTGAMTPAQFAAATTPEALAAALAKTQLPGRVAAPGSAAAATLGSAPAPAAGGSGGDGLSRTVVIIIAVVASVAGVAIITLAIVLGKWLAGRNEEDLADQETSVAMSGGSGRYWWRSPLWGRGDSGSAPSGQTLAGSSSLKY